MDEYAYMIIEKMGFSSHVEIKKKKRYPVLKKKKGLSWPQTSSTTIVRQEKKRLTFMTCLFYKNPCYQLRLKDGLIQTVDLTWNIRHFKHSNAMIK
jgi:hypothetical protein